nr:MAG TPA: G5-linked-Ubiquitin-like domain [Caudoviricetes sp.]
MRLRPGTVKLQFAATDGDGNPITVSTVEKTIEEFLKEAGYD